MAAAVGSSVGTSTVTDGWEVGEPASSPETVASGSSPEAGASVALRDPETWPVDASVGSAAGGVVADGAEVAVGGVVAVGDWVAVGSGSELHAALTARSSTAPSPSARIAGLRRPFDARVPKLGCPPGQ